MKLFEKSADLSIDPSLDKLLFILSTLIFLSISPYFIWENQLLILRIAHLVGNTIILYIIIRYYNFNVNNKELALFFFIISLYTMVAGTEIHKFTYIPLLTILFISLRPSEQLRIFNYIVTFLAVVYAFGLVSYLLSIFGLNRQIGEAIAPNIDKEPYKVFFGHVEESFLPVYRFSSIFDEAGVVGTLNGLILSVIGISRRNIKSIILLMAGLVSFSLAFYIILLINLLFYFNFKKVLFAILLLVGVAFFSGDKFNELIADRLIIENGTIAGDNRTHDDFDEYFKAFKAKGGNDLIFGRGYVTADTDDDLTYVSNYKVIIVRYGIIGAGLILLFYASFVFLTYNSKRGWFLFLVFTISAYQRPDMLVLFNIALFVGGLEYLKQDDENKIKALKL